MAEQQKLTKGRRDWSDLPSDLVHLIAKKLPDLPDVVRVHFTCKSWCSATPLSDFPCGFPWLLEFQNPQGFISTPTRTLNMYSMLSGETFTIPIKKTKWFRGSSHSYLPLIDHSTGVISLLNPLTNDEFVLPFVHNPRKVFWSFAVWREQGPIRDRRIFILHHGKHRSDFSQWAIYDPHHGLWTVQDGLCIYSCYCRGMFFFAYMNAGKPTKVVDVSTKELLYRIPPHADEITDAHPPGEHLRYVRIFRSYLIDSSGDILRVNWYYPNYTLRKSKFLIYRLNEQNIGDQRCWVKLSDVGDQNIFLEVIQGNPNEANGFSITVAPASGLRGGRIYFIDPFDGKPYLHDIRSNTEEAIPCPFEKCTWFVPGLF